MDSAAGALQVLAGGPERILLTWLIPLVLACGHWIQERELRTSGREGRISVFVHLQAAVSLTPRFSGVWVGSRGRGTASAVYGPM